MTDFTIEQIDTALESRIISALVTNTEFIQEVRHAIDLGYFRNTYHQRIAKIAIGHFDSFKSALGFDGLNLSLQSDSKRFKPDELVNVRDAANALAARGELRDNIPYLVAEAIKFFKKRELEITANNIRYYLEEGQVDEAEKVLNDYVRIERKFSDIHDLFDEEILLKHFAGKDNEFFKMPGDLGRFLGNMQRGWLVGIMGKFKGGKSWLAMEFGIIGMLSNLNVAFFSLEMTEEGMYERIFKRLSVSADRHTVLNPVFDCKKNQSDECQFARRTNNIALDWSPGEVVDLRKNRQYQVCTFCKEREAFFSHYEPATWYEQIEVPVFDQMVAGGVKDRLSVFFKNRFKFKAYPRFTANIEDIKRDLNVLEVTEGWVPDIIIVDYADILKPESGGATEGYEKEDRSWIALAQLAGEQKALVITPTQVTTDGLDAYLLKTKHTARWRGKLGHVDAMVTINQTEEEKRCGLMRVSYLEHRHAEFYETDCCTVLQNLKTAQVHLDSVRTQSRSEGE
jgi:hypothetical protein